MKVIKDKINEELIKSKKLREYAFDTSFKNSFKVRQEQDVAYKKFLFFKNLNKAVEKVNKEK